MAGRNAYRSTSGTSRGVAVNRQAWATPIDDFTPVLDSAALAENQPTRVEVGEQAIVLVRQGDEVYALRERCSHLGGPLAGGKVEGGCLILQSHLCGETR
jgi:phenylpropionate dioxygenase-like ring-hydroxylating dioxygenase large terminal subunit